ncbi:hypothetical protein CGRA01v4_11044 [Colletotrichum graminicola]|nr:hypothetical protein CGRA01v4_11044 [Colletotrichum graminicola]
MTDFCNHVRSPSTGQLFSGHEVSGIMERLPSSVDLKQGRSAMNPTRPETGSTSKPLYHGRNPPDRTDGPVTMLRSWPR